MTRARTVHRCAECGAEAPRWSGRCPTCSAWNALVVQMLGELARSGARCLLVSAEESSQQVRLRAERLGALEPDLWLFPAGSLPAIVGAVGELEPDVVVVDSIQTIAEPALGSAPGTVAQVRECARQLAAMAKDRGLTTVLVGHVNKEGA